MSQYVTIQTKVTDKMAALSALRILGFDGDTVFVDDTGALELYDYRGILVPDTHCNIRICKEDIEFSRDPEAVRNDFGIDLRTGTVWLEGAAKEQSVLGRFMQEYAVQLAMRHQEAQGRRVSRVDDPETGKVHLYVNEN